MKILSVNNYQTQNQNVNSYSDQRANFTSYSNPKAKLNDITFTSTLHVPAKGNLADNIMGFKPLRDAFLAAEKKFFVQPEMENIIEGLEGIARPIEIPAADGTKMFALVSPEFDPTVRTIAYHHGNQDTATGKLAKQMYEIFKNEKLNFIAYEPRGFVSQKFADPNQLITRETLLSDSVSAIKYLESLGISTENILPVGHSLGGCTVLNLPEFYGKKFGGIFVNSGFPDSPKLSQFVSGQQFPFLKILTDNAHPELSFNLNPELAWNNLKALKYLKEQGIETVVLQAKDDLAQPYHLAKLLEDEAKKIGFDKFKFIIVPDGGHDILTTGKIDAFINFFRENRNAV